MMVSRLRGGLVLACCLLSLAACASEDEGLLAMRPSGTTPTPDEPAEVEPTPGAWRTAPPTPTPLPSGFDNSGTRPGAFDIAGARAIGLDGGNRLYVASAPHDGPPYGLTVMSEFGTVLATASLALMPERFAFLKSDYVYAAGNAVVTMNASHSVVSTERYTDGAPEFVALAPSFPDSNQNGKVAYAVAAGTKVYLSPPSTSARTFPNAAKATRIAYAPSGDLWGVGGTTLAQFNRIAEDEPVVTIADLGTLKDLAFDPGAILDNSFWVLGASGLAHYNALGERQGDRIALAGGDRLFVKNGKPIVVKDAAGEIHRFKADGTAEPVVKLEGGIAGAAMDAQGNLWVSSLAEGRVLHTRF